MPGAVGITPDARPLRSFEASFAVRSHMGGFRNRGYCTFFGSSGKKDCGILVCLGFQGLTYCGTLGYIQGSKDYRILGFLQGSLILGNAHVHFTSLVLVAQSSTWTDVLWPPLARLFELSSTLVPVLRS